MKMYIFLALLLLLTSLHVEAYTESDVKTGCSDCSASQLIPHPTDCQRYYFCDPHQGWREVSCAASTDFDYSSKRCRAQTEYQCPGGYANMDIYDLAECAGQKPQPTTAPTTKQESSPTTDADGSDKTTAPDRDDDEQKKITIILSVLLCSVVFLVILAVAIFFIVRRYKSKRRPRSIYSSIPGQKGKRKQGGASNDLYMKRSLIHQRQKTQEDMYSTVRDDQEANMDSGIDESETDDRNKPYYSLPPNRRRPRVPVHTSSTLPPAPPVPTAAPTNAPYYADHTVQYARTESNEESATYQPIDENPIYQPLEDDPNYSSVGYQLPQTDGGYECPQTVENHTYEIARPEGEADTKSAKALSVPAVAPRPVETLRRADQTLPATPNAEGAPQPPPRGASHQTDNAEHKEHNSESQPYYLDVEADQDVQEALIQPLHNYHTLEPPNNRK